MSEPIATDVEGEPVERPDGKRIDGKLGCFVTLILGIACVGLAWLILQKKSSLQLNAASEFAELVKQAEEADGVGALKSAGCERAAVLPTEALITIAQRLENDRAQKEKREARAVNMGTARVVIVCGIPAKTELACAPVATAFASSVKNVMLPFITIVEREGVSLCTSEFSGDEKTMKDMTTTAVPPLFASPE